MSMNSICAMLFSSASPLWLTMGGVEGLSSNKMPTITVSINSNPSSTNPVLFKSNMLFFLSGYNLFWDTETINPPTLDKSTAK
jgi:hypothetical protein